MHFKLSGKPTAHKYCRLIYDSTFDSDPDWGWRNLKRSGKSFLQAATEAYDSTGARSIFPCSPSLERKATEFVLRQFIVLPQANFALLFQQPIGLLQAPHMALLAGMLQWPQQHRLRHLMGAFSLEVKIY